MPLGRRPTKSSLALVAAFLVFYAAYQPSLWPSQVDESTIEDSTVMLQTFQAVDPRDPERAGLQLGETDAHGVVDASILSGMARSGNSDPCFSYHQSFMATGWFTTLEMLRLLEYVPQRVACPQPDAASRAELLFVDFSQSISTRFGLFLSPDAVAWLPTLIPIVFCSIFFIFLLVMMLNIIWLAPSRYTKDKQKSDSKKQLDKDRRPEYEAWNRGLLSWLYIDHCSEWIAKFGNASEDAPTQINVDSLGKLGDPDDDLERTYRKLERLWQEEVETNGKSASLFNVCARCAGYDRIMILMGWSALFQSCAFFIPPLCMMYLIRNLDWVFSERAMGVYIVPAKLLVSTGLSIGLFTVLPVFMGIASTMCNLMAMRTCIRVCGALSALVYAKAQRLPMMRAGDQDAKQRIDGSDERLKVDKEDAAEGSKSDDEAEAPDTETDITYDEDGNWLEPKEFNLVQLVANDVNLELILLPQNLCKGVTGLPINIVLFAMLIGHIHVAIWLDIVLVFGFLGLIGFIVAGLTNRMNGYFYFAGQRLKFVEDLLFNIRTVKACGWEEISGQRVQKIRDIEITVLTRFYRFLGCMFCTFQQYPYLFIIASIWGYMWLTGADQPPRIWETLPILASFQAAMLDLVGSVPPIAMAMPCFFRIKAFLTLEESLIGKPRDVEVPHFMSVWPQNPDSSSQGGPLIVHGSFGWAKNDSPVLKDLDFCVPFGTSVGVIGKVGSGKTTFLHAILGELYPVGDARVSVPLIVAHSAQQPYCLEGTLRENVLFGAPFEQKRYDLCVDSCSLLPDIEMLPGGDQVPIGSRGISLSGGQKARVSMARAGYTKAPVVLVDDPFGALDSRTAARILERYVHGPCLEGRTRIVCTQPDAERIEGFDLVVLLDEGRIIQQGTPAEVKKTEAYRAMLNEQQRENLENEDTSGKNVVAKPAENDDRAAPVANNTQAFQLREDEHEGRADWSTFGFFIWLGGPIGFCACLFGFLGKTTCELMMMVQLQTWSSKLLAVNHGLSTVIPGGLTYLKPFLLWWLGANICWWICWYGGMSYTLTLSKSSNEMIMKSIMYAPVDLFFDKTPVGRIMNRLSTDLQNVDTQVFNTITQAIATGEMIAVPLFYVHVCLPFYFTLITLPLYISLFLVVRRYWRTMVPMRYLTSVSKSRTDTLLTEVDYSNSFARALQRCPMLFESFQEKVSEQLIADMSTQFFVQRWVVMRIYLVCAFFVTTMALICIWVPNVVTFGVVGLCFTNMLKIQANIEIDTTTLGTSQFQFISMNRIHEYTKLPSEKAFFLETDIKYKSFSVTIPRAKLGKVKVRQNLDGSFATPVQLVSVPFTGGPERVILEFDTQGKKANCAFRPPQGMTFSILDPSCEDFKKASDWHRLICVNSSRGSIETMVNELCKGTSPDIKLQIESGWLLDGAKIVIEDLVAGYGEIPRRILDEITTTIEPSTNVGIVGTTGCGKSTLLLTLLRILEPRGGSIKINGVDTKDLGLGTLRTNIGLVPQDPVLMQNSLRVNLDPFDQADETMIWEGLELVQLKETVRALNGGLDFELENGKTNLSFGQRQLLCLARMVIRQPRLILLDEATSALDPKTQEIVQNTIDKTFPDSTLVVVAHRLETIANFDKIIVLDKGHLAEEGPHDYLKNKKGGIFAKMLAAKGM